MQTATQLYAEGQKLLFNGDKEGAFSKFTLAAAQGSEEAKAILKALYNFDASTLSSPMAGTSAAGISDASGDAASSYPDLSNYDRDEFEINSIGTLVKYKGRGGDVLIPRGVSGINEEAFCQCYNMTSVCIPDGVRYIADRAFGACDGLTSVVIPDSAKAIGEGAFAYCDGLKSVTLPNGLVYIYRSTFEFCSRLTSVNIPSTVISIGERAFRNCSALTSIKIPDGVISIERNAFSFCSSLTSVSIPVTVSRIDEQAFDYCSSMQTIVLPSKFKYHDIGLYPKTKVIYY